MVDRGDLANKLGAICLPKLDQWLMALGLPGVYWTKGSSNIHKPEQLRFDLAKWDSSLKHRTLGQPWMVLDWMEPL